MQFRLVVDRIQVYRYAGYNPEKKRGESDFLGSVPVPRAPIYKSELEREMTDHARPGKMLDKASLTPEERAELDAELKKVKEELTASFQRSIMRDISLLMGTVRTALEEMTEEELERVCTQWDGHWIYLLESSARDLLEVAQRVRQAKGKPSAKKSSSPVETTDGPDAAEFPQEDVAELSQEDAAEPSQEDAASEIPPADMIVGADGRAWTKGKLKDVVATAQAAPVQAARDQARQLYQEGKKLSEIATELSVSLSSVSRWKKADLWDQSK